MKNIVITGSNRGIGYGLAEAFLERNCRVMVTGRSQTRTEQAVNRLAAKYGDDRVAGCPCDVSQPEQVQKLWDTAVKKFSTVDIWVNNAGINHAMKSIWELSPETLQNVLQTNLLGIAYCSQVAIRGMLTQGTGYIYNMEGHGSDGQIMPGMSGYGTSKSAVRYFTKALIQETQGTAVKVSTISPGMVNTTLMHDQFKGDPEGLERAKAVFEMLGDSVDIVAPWLVERMLENNQAGAAISWLTAPKIMWRVLTGYFKNREVFTNQQPASIGAKV